MYRAYIIDDEPKAIDNLEFLLEQEVPEITTIGRHSNPLIALQQLHEFKPDLLFLDVQMPHLDGFGLLKSLGDNIPFEIIFTTAYEQYAIQAIRAKAIDYLLKPIDGEDLKKAFDRFVQKQATQVAESSDLVSGASLDRLAIQMLEGVRFLNFEKIVRLEADGNYTRIFTDEKEQIISSKTLKIYEEILLERGFFRVHHSHLINSSKINALLKNELLLLQDGSEIPVSRRRKSELKQFLGLD